MPRYYFDTDDGDFSHQDATGQDLADVQAARREAIAVLPAMARDKLPDGDRCAFEVRVRDDAGTVIYAANLSLVGAWQVTPPPT